MPVQAADTEIVYTGNGSATVFAFPFKIQQAADFAALVAGSLTTAYSLAGIDDDNGGTCTFDTAPASGAAVVLYRVVPYDRTLTDYQEVGEFAANTVDSDVDRVVMQTQQLATAMKRTPQLAVGSSLDGLTLTPEASTLLQWNAAGDAIVNVSPSVITPDTVGITAYIETLFDDPDAATARATLMTPDLVTHAPVNVQLVASVAANALTIALKGHDGNDHSATNVGYIPFRSLSLPSGAMAVRAVTGALSLTIPAGATIGNVGNDQPIRIWIVAFDDGVILRLGAICPLFYVPANAYAGTGGPTIYPLAPSGRADAVLIDTAADNSGVFYAAATVSARAYTVLGYLEYTAGLATAGTYNIAPTNVQPWVVGMPMPGDTVKFQRNNDGAMVTGTTVTPYDDTIPQVGEGVSVLGLIFYQSSLCNLNVVSAHVMGANSNTDSNGTFALHVDGVNAALAATAVGRNGAANSLFDGDLRFAWVPNVFPVNYRTRFGTDSAGTFTLNGNGGARRYGGRALSYLEVAEIMV